jgi:hypothetical protein
MFDTIWFDLQFVAPANPSSSSINVIAAGVKGDTMTITSLFQPFADVVQEELVSQAHENIYFDGEGLHGPAEPFELHIFDLRGSLIERSRHPASRIVTLHHLASASYFIRVDPSHSAPRTLRIHKR